MYPSVKAYKVVIFGLLNFYSKPTVSQTYIQLRVLHDIQK